MLACWCWQAGSRILSVKGARKTASEFVIKAALVRREGRLLHRDDLVDDRFDKITASFLSVLSGESVIHLCFVCFSVTTVYRLSLEN